MRETTETIRLNADGIERASEAARKLLNEKRNKGSRATATWPPFEDDPLELRDHFDEDVEAHIAARNVLGRLRLIIKVPGERFDPRDQGKLGRWEHITYEASGMVPGHEYLWGYSIVTLAEARKQGRLRQRRTRCEATRVIAKRIRRT